MQHYDSSFFLGCTSQALVCGFIGCCAAIRQGVGKTTGFLMGSVFGSLFFLGQEPTVMKLFDPLPVLMLFFPAACFFLLLDRQHSTAVLKVVALNFAFCLALNPATSARVLSAPDTVAAYFAEGSTSKSVAIRDFVQRQATRLKALSSGDEVPEEGKGG